VQRYYRWRKEFGGLKLEQAKRLKELEKENGRLKRLGSRTLLGEAGVARRGAGKLLSPRVKRQLVCKRSTIGRGDESSNGTPRSARR
jgi:hypothetical protein